MSTQAQISSKHGRAPQDLLSWLGEGLGPSNPSKLREAYRDIMTCVKKVCGKASVSEVTESEFRAISSVAIGCSAAIACSDTSGVLYQLVIGLSAETVLAAVRRLQDERKLNDLKRELNRLEIEFRDHRRSHL